MLLNTNKKSIFGRKNIENQKILSYLCDKNLVRNNYNILTIKTV